jgi:hypothetical protein
MGTSTYYCVVSGTRWRPYYVHDKPPESLGELGEVLVGRWFEDLRPLVCGTTRQTLMLPTLERRLFWRALILTINTESVFLTSNSFVVASKSLFSPMSLQSVSV